VGTPQFLEMPRSIPVLVLVQAPHSLPPDALRRVREFSEVAAAAPPTELKALLAKGVSLGLRAPYQAMELREILEPLGFRVTCTPHVDEI
jgi:hypothetical protein